MADDTVNVKIVGDASGVAPGVNEAKGQIEGLATATKSASSAMKESFAGVSVSVREMGVQVRETFEAINGFREMLTGVGEAMIAAFAIEKVADWTKEMGEAAEKTTHLAETFGMSVGQVQQLGGVASATGISLDSVVRGMGILDKNMVNAAGSSSSVGKALKAVGIEAGDTRNQMQLMESVADKFKTMDDGPKKVALAMALFGKSGKELIPILNLGAEGLAEINRKSEEYGVVNEAATAKGMALAESVNESHLAMSGLANTMTDAFAPMLKAATDGMNSLIKAFIDSYKEGGYVKVVLETLSATIEILGTVFSGIGEIFSEVWGLITEVIYDIAKSWADVFGIKMGEGAATTEGALNRIKAVFVWLKDGIVEQILIIKLMLEGLVGFVSVCGTVIDEALTGQWGKIEASWSEGLANLARQTEATKNKIVANANEMVAALSSVWTGKALAGAGGGIPAPKGGGGGDLGFHGGGGGGDHKKDKADSGMAQQWRTELATMLADEANWGKDEAKLALDFWEKKLVGLKKGSKEEIEVSREIARAKLAIHKEEMQDTVAGIKQLEALKIEAAKSDYDLAKLNLTEKLAIIADEEKAGTISAQAALRQKAAVNQQMLQLDVDLENKEFQAKQDGIAKQFQLDHQSDKARADLWRQSEVLWAQHQNKLVLLHKQANKQMSDDDRALELQKRQATLSWTQSWSQNIAKMVTLQQSFGTTIKNIWNDMLSNFAAGVARMVEQWLLGLVLKEAASKSFHIGETLRMAKDAAAGAFAAIAKIPFVGPFLAPAAAAAAFAATMAFSAKDGYDVPALAGAGIDGRGGQVGIVHPREMILPADLADQVRNGDMGGGSPIYISAMDTQSIAKFARDNGHHFADGIKKAARNGWRG